MKFMLEVKLIRKVFGASFPLLPSSRLAGVQWTDPTTGVLLVWAGSTHPTPSHLPSSYFTPDIWILASFLLGFCQAASIWKQRTSFLCWPLQFLERAFTIPWCGRLPYKTCKIIQEASNPSVCALLHPSLATPCRSWEGGSPLITIIHPSIDLLPGLPILRKHPNHKS